MKRVVLRSVLVLSVLLVFASAAAQDPALPQHDPPSHFSRKLQQSWRNQQQPFAGGFGANRGQSGGGNWAGTAVQRPVRVPAPAPLPMTRPQPLPLPLPQPQPQQPVIKPTQQPPPLLPEAKPIQQPRPQPQPQQPWAKPQQPQQPDKPQQQQQPQPIPASGNKGPRGPRPQPNLNRFTGAANQFKNVGAKPIETAGEAATLRKDIETSSPKNVAESLANAVKGGRGDAAAKAIAAAAAGGASAAAVGKAVAETSKVRPEASTLLLRRSADFAVSNGHVRGFSAAMSQAFMWGRSQGFLPSLVSSVANAILGGGPETRYAFGSSIAVAIADGGDSRAAVVEATATAMCTGGSTAQAWAEAYAVTIEQDSMGCTVLKEAHAMAYAKCGPGYAVSWAKTESTYTVLGYCGVFDDPAYSDVDWVEFGRK